MIVFRMTTMRRVLMGAYKDISQSIHHAACPLFPSRIIPLTAWHLFVGSYAALR